MTHNPKIISQAQALRDRYAALLRDSLRVLDVETVSEWITQLEGDMHQPENEPADRLSANATLVGILSVMLESMESKP